MYQSFLRTVLTAPEEYRVGIKGLLGGSRASIYKCSLDPKKEVMNILSKFKPSTEGYLIINYMSEGSTTNKTGNMVASKLLALDFDPKPKDRPLLSEEIEEIQMYLDRTEVLKEYSYLVSSGGGIHVYYVLPEVVDIESWRTLAMAMHRIAACVPKEFKGRLDNDRSVYNKNFMLRLPGTFNNKENRNKVCEIVACNHNRTLSKESMNMIRHMDENSWNGVSKKVKKTPGLVTMDEVLAIIGLEPNKNLTYQKFICPFPDHEDNTPSFTVFYDTDTWKCFGAEHKNDGDEAGIYPLNLVYELLASYKRSGKTESEVFKKLQYLSMRIREENNAKAVKEVTPRDPSKEDKLSAKQREAADVIATLRSKGVEVFSHNGDLLFLEGDYIKDDVRSSTQQSNYIFNVAKITMSSTKHIHTLVPQGRPAYRPDREERVFLDESLSTPKIPRYIINTYIASEYGKSEKKVGEIPDHIYAVLENLFPIEVVREKFIEELAYAWQRKYKSGKAWVIYGYQGTGKNLMFDHVIKKIFGSNNSVTLDSNKLLSTFDEHLDKCLWLCYNESEMTAQQRSKVNGKLKQLITDDTIHIEEKFKSKRQVRLWNRTIIYSNDEVPVKLEVDDRRFIVSKTSRIRLDHLPIFKGKNVLKVVTEELEDFACYLAGYDLTMGGKLTYEEVDNEIRNVIVTPEKESMKRFSQTLFIRFLMEVKDGTALDWLEDCPYIDDQQKMDALKQLQMGFLMKSTLNKIYRQLDDRSIKQNIPLSEYVEKYAAMILDQRRVSAMSNRPLRAFFMTYPNPYQKEDPLLHRKFSEAKKAISRHLWDTPVATKINDVTLDVVTPKERYVAHQLFEVGLSPEDIILLHETREFESLKKKQKAAMLLVYTHKFDIAKIIIAMTLGITYGFGPMEAV